MIDDKLVKQQQILALLAVEFPTWEDWYRRICRWYSKEFSTPIAEVYGLTETEVVRAYFEDNFFTAKQKTDEEGLAQWIAIKNHVIHGEEIEDLEKQVEAEDDDWMRKELAAAAKDHEAALAKKEPVPEPNLEVKPEPEEVFVQGEDSADFLNNTEYLEEEDGN